MKRKDGIIFPTEHNATPLEDKQGKRIGWVNAICDITERKRAEEELKSSELVSPETAVEYGAKDMESLRTTLTIGMSCCRKH